MISVLGIYAAAGAVAGILAGLLGVGGGLVIVPILVYCFGRQAIPGQMIMHLALGTSMASIMFTSIPSFWFHHRRQAVQWPVVRRIVFGILVGTFLGACLASRLSTTFLKGFFVIFLYYAAIQMLTGKKPKPNRQIPGPEGMFGAGGLIGGVSSLVGIGGGSLSVPFLVWCNAPMREAIGTSAAIGFPLAVSGTIGYIYSGMSATHLPHLSLGYVYLPALLGIIALSMLTAPIGVRLAHNLPVNKLKRVFAVLLLAVGTRMLVGLF